MNSCEKLLLSASAALLILDCRKEEVVFCNYAAANLLQSPSSTITIDKVLKLDGFYLIYLLPYQSWLNESVTIHQLRAPMTAIKWGIEALLEEKMNPAQYGKLQDIYKTNQYAINLVNDLLDTAKLQPGKIKAEKKVTDIKPLILDITQLLQPLVEQKKQRVNLRIESSTTTGFFDQKLFTKTFENLLDNAIGYGEANSDITMVVSDNGNNLKIAINNQGLIIAPSEKGRIFEKFYRSEGSKKIKPSGTGLGLFIAKSSAEANGGKIWFDSEEERGTTFYFTVPKDAVL